MLLRVRSRSVEIVVRTKPRMGFRRVQPPVTTRGQPHTIARFAPVFTGSRRSKFSLQQHKKSYQLLIGVFPPRRVCTRSRNGNGPSHCGWGRH